RYTVRGPYTFRGLPVHSHNVPDGDKRRRKPDSPMWSVRDPSQVWTRRRQFPSYAISICCIVVHLKNDLDIRLLFSFKSGHYLVVMATAAPGTHAAVNCTLAVPAGMPAGSRKLT